MTFNRKDIRRFFLFLADSIIIILSFCLALQIAGREIPDIHYRWYEYLWMFSVLFSVKFFVFARTGFYSEIVQFASVDFAFKIIKSTIFGSVVAIMLIHIVRHEIEMPVLIVDWMASCILIGLSRFGWRYAKEGHFSHGPGRNTLLYGAGEHGATVARHLMLNNHLGYRVVGYIDDSAGKIGKKIQGVPVLGGVADLQKIIQKFLIEELVVSFSNPDGDLVKELFTICRGHGVRCRIVPGMNDVILGKDIVRNIDIVDLMRRPRRMLDKSMIGELLRDKRVMITGAAGSIGSEIFRQVLAYEPKAVAALDYSEYGLYKLDEEFASHPSKGRCFFSLVDIKIPELVNDAFRRFKPDIVFHAAAYKHVPILEQDVRQAIFNNVKGLMNVIDASKNNHVAKFIFISTDKAVRPTNVMGATKRIGELLVQSAGNGNGMQCLGVRFGNVLASSGSVVPKFVAQIKAGGPVTVTHPDITRYFMLIPEAVELVLQSASIGKGREIFVLDMGNPVKIAEMAEDLISLMGYVPRSEIPIVFTGLRPGEKLHEELFLDDIESPTSFKDIHIGRATPIDADKLKSALDMLVSISETTYDLDDIRAEIRKIVPEYQG